MKYHTRISGLCHRFCLRYKGAGIINSFKEAPISISHLTDIREDPYKYKPDSYFIRNKDKRFITFQVLSSQVDKPKEIVGDILNAILTYHIKIGYFILPKKSDLNKIENLLKISYSILQDIYLLKKGDELPQLKPIVIENRKTNQEINILFEELIKKDKWFK
jgi:hypothetical protein